MRRAGRAALLVLMVAAAFPVQAAQLVLYETQSCPWCKRWQRDIGGRYAETKAGHLLPLRRVDMQKPLPADLAAIPHVAAIPTFVLVQCGREVGRVVGYSNEATFWNALADVVNDWQDRGAADRC
ncbi:MAG: hypothetical protein K2X44_12455 [Magnetospirillum sp.]|nr:hypothetical protein [Magnetospirillum sp.]